jgi:Na+-translocating ferredoxin:NAD+ oxidoreductase RnfG subunit
LTKKSGIAVLSAIISSITILVHALKQIKPILSLACTLATLISGCSKIKAEVSSFTEDQINYLATSRCLYHKGILTQARLTERMKRHASNDPNGFIDPIIKSSIHGMSQEQDKRVLQAIEEKDCQKRVLDWAVIEFPVDNAAELMNLYMAKKDQTKN